MPCLCLMVIPGFWSMKKSAKRSLHNNCSWSIASPIYDGISKEFLIARREQVRRIYQTLSSVQMQCLLLHGALYRCVASCEPAYRRAKLRSKEKRADIQ